MYLHDVVTRYSKFGIEQKFHAVPLATFASAVAVSVSSSLGKFFTARKTVEQVMNDGLSSLLLV